MPMTWTDQADARLLVGIILLHNFKIDHRALATFMGKDCSVSAIQHRIQRIKERVRNDSSPSRTAATTTSESAPQQGEGESTPSSSPVKSKKDSPRKRVRSAKSEGDNAPKRPKVKPSDDSA
ncbi:hypothetical protein BDV28DRAFT_82779 [Aspergillus coremiiformis]|uniref:AT hook motif protein n=1 Tax=Aspergillus coremiiformis TaxID=138285 RepID=A0A5N6ZG37_9EURO|nr:hypothetical protein BDV28DRAFT_82779 [Aspergillus coremiiformis]